MCLQVFLKESAPLKLFAMKGVVKCCVCKAFCSKKAKKCVGCGKQCHDKCRQDMCCRPCNLCWEAKTRSCACGKSLRSLGVVFTRVENIMPDTPPLKRKKMASVITPTSAAPPSTSTSTEKENVCMFLCMCMWLCMFIMCVHPCVCCVSGG